MVGKEIVKRSLEQINKEISNMNSTKMDIKGLIKLNQCKIRRAFLVQTLAKMK